MKTRILVLFCAVSLCASAQTPKRAITIIGGGKAHLGYFVNPFCQIGKIAGPVAVLPGLQAGVLLGNSLSLGLSYKFIATENTPAGEADTRLYLDQSYAGFRAGYAILPKSMVHLNIQFEAGAGHTELDLKDFYNSYNSEYSGSDATFAYFEPGVALEINVWTYLKLDVAAQYRFVGDVSFRNMTGKDYSGVNYTASLKIGLF